MKIAASKFIHKFEGCLRDDRSDALKDHLRTPEQSQRSACFSMRNNRIPYLRGSSEVGRSRNTIHRSITRGAKVVRLQFDCRKPAGPGWKVRDAAITASRIRQGH